MTSRSALRRLLKEAADGGQVSENAVKVLGRMSDELLESVADRAAEISEDAGARRVDAVAVVAAWRERVIARKKNEDDGGGPGQHGCRQKPASQAPRPPTENRGYI